MTQSHSHPRVFFDWKKPFACRVRILFVTDASGGFDEIQGFHLGQVLKALANDPWSHVIFDVTKAHRQTEATADISDFRFDQADLTEFDQIWLFGIYGSGSDDLSQAELRALAEFMDGGGGVFATGDHQNLGQAVAAEVPRVRSMRRWHFPSPGPNGEPVAPDVIGPNSHSTLTDDPATPSLEQDQSDHIPQRIRPRYYTALSGGSLFPKLVKFPHPVLCGPAGVINHLPDHMHEGLCEVPADLSRSYTFAGYTTEEYPAVGARRPAPEVIAWALNDNTGSEFGVIAAYDGHRADVGRVVVDATWHHWFNINLVGLLAATDPAGPSYDPAVVPKWNEIKAYYHNVAAWLSPKPLQRCLRNGGWLFITRSYDILMTRRDLAEVPDRLQYFWQLGVFARDALGRRAGRCQRTRWWLDLADLVKLPLVADVWGPRSPEPDPPPWIDVDDLQTVLLGGAVHALTEAFADLDDIGDIEAVRQRADDIERVARDGADRALTEVVEGQLRSVRSLERHLRERPAFG